MKIAITGGTGFVGSHLASRLADGGHEVRLVARGTRDRPPALRDLPHAEFVAASVGDTDALRDAFAGCDAVAHLAGINFERGSQTYETVHVEGTRNVVEAAEDAGTSTVVLSSFLRARPSCGSAYHESKWAAEEIVRGSGLDYTVLKPGVTYGRGDHVLEHVSRWLATVPVFGLVGFEERRLRPLAVQDLVDVAAAALTGDRLSETTVAVVGPEELGLREVVRRIGAVVDRTPLMVPVPVRVHDVIALLQERVMETPITSTAQVRMLQEGATDPAPDGVCDPLPDDLRPGRPFSRERIERGLPEPRPYGLADLRWWSDSPPDRPGEP